MSILNFFRRKKEDRPVPEREPDSFLCMILSSRTTPPSDASVRSALERAFPSKASVRDAEDAIWMLEIPGLENAFASFVPMPIPDGEAEDAADSFLWPDGSRFAVHQSHVILGSAGEHKNKVKAVLALTKLAAAMLDACDGIAVYWGSGSITVPRDQFVDFAEDADADDLPLFLWCRFQVTQSDEGRVGLYTLGLRQFGLMEIEVDESSKDPKELLEFVFNVAHYLVQNGPVIKDGDTVGGSAEERIVVKRGQSVLDATQSVYKIVGL